MKITIEITDEMQIKKLEALRGDKSAKEFAAICFTWGLNLTDFQRHQATEAAKHPLLQFPEAKAEFKSLDIASVEKALKGKNPADPVSIEATRLVTAYLAQLKEYARQNGGRFPAAMPINSEIPAIEKASFKIAVAVVRDSVRKGSKKAKAA